MKISIVIPVCNVAPYVVRCMDSVVCQTYGDLECIIVDDCGEDRSMEIVRERLAAYAGRVEFKIACHDRNRGLSAARNTGTNAATGEYVYYLDGDDLILPDSIELLAKPLEKAQLDVVIGNYASGGNAMCFLPLRTPYEICQSNQEIRRAYLSEEWYVMAWNKLVRRAFLMENRLQFLEGLLHEDHLWSFKLACTAQSMGVVNVITYVYYMRQGSITMSSNRRHLDSWIRISDEAEAFALARGLDGDADVCRFLMHLREILADRAKPYGRKVAFDVYCNNVRQPSVFKLPARDLSGLELIRHIHCLLPPSLGFVYYTAGLRIFGCGFSFFHKVHMRVSRLQKRKT
jgi:hypothetical protein